MADHMGQSERSAEATEARKSVYGRHVARTVEMVRALRKRDATVARFLIDPDAKRRDTRREGSSS